MSRFAAVAFLAFLSTACTSTGEAREASNQDAMSEMDESEFGVSVTRKRNIAHYDQAQRLVTADPATTRILVTTEEAAPDPRTFAVAEAIHVALRTRYPMAEFKVAGLGRTSLLKDEATERFDYAFVVSTNSNSRDYESERTVYESRSTGVRCKQSLTPGAIDCDERGSESVPVGTRKQSRSIYTERFIVEYGPAANTTVLYSGNDYRPVMGVTDRIGWTVVSMVSGTTDSSWCDKDGEALTFIAGLAGTSIVSSRPDEMSLTLDPDSIGCNG